MGTESRPIADHSPDIWGDKFTFIPRDIELWEAYSKERDVLKNEARSMLVSSACGDWRDTLILIDTIERLGIGYHFAESIEDKLAEIHKAHNLHENYDLFSTAISFRILRQHGYSVTSEIFNKYKSADGKFDEAITRDPVALVSLYDAAHLRRHGELVLDQILSFTTSHLKSMALSLDISGSLSKLVRRSLVQPLHKGNPRIEAKHFILFYQERPSRNDVLLKFAKLDFNMLQMLYKQELSHVKRWWDAMEIDSKFPQFRSRIVEGYFWALGISFEPCYALSRIMYTKTLCTLSVVDDLYDAYGTIDELNTFTKAVQRFDIESIKGLPDHSKLGYTMLLNILSEFEEALVKQGSYSDVFYVKRELQALIRAYHQDAIWCNEKYVPRFKEYMTNGIASAALCVLGVTTITGMGHVDTTHACNWAANKAKAVLTTDEMARIINDIAGYEREHITRPHAATSIDSYMKEYGVSKEEALVKLYEMIEDTWKDMNEECLNQTQVGRQYITVYLNLMRMCHVMYHKDFDAYSYPEVYLKDDINFVIVDPLPI